MIGELCAYHETMRSVPTSFFVSAMITLRQKARTFVLYHSQKKIELLLIQHPYTSFGLK